MHDVPRSVRIEAQQASLDESQANIDGLLESSRDGYVTSMLRIAEAAGVPEDSRETLRLELEIDADTVINGIFEAFKVYLEKDEEAKEAGDSAMSLAKQVLREQRISKGVERMLSGRNRG